MYLWRPDGRFWWRILLISSRPFNEGTELQAAETRNTIFVHAAASQCVFLFLFFVLNLPEFPLKSLCAHMVFVTTASSGDLWTPHQSHPLSLVITLSHLEKLRNLMHCGNMLVFVVLTLTLMLNWGPGVWTLSQSCIIGLTLSQLSLWADVNAWTQTVSLSFMNN